MAANYHSNSLHFVSRSLDFVFFIFIFLFPQTHPLKDANIEYIPIALGKQVVTTADGSNTVS